VLPKLLQLLTATPQAVSGALLAFHLLLVKFALAIATRLFVLLPGAAGCAIEAPLFAVWAETSWQQLATSPALEPILALLLVDPVLHGILTSFAYHASGREGDHGGIEVFNAFAVATMNTPQDVSLLAAGKAFLAISLLQLSSWESILDLGQLADAARIFDGRVELALAHDLPVLALRAHGGHVGPHLFPLLVLKAVEVPNLLTMGARCMRIQAFGIGGQVDVLALQLLKEQLGPVGHPALEKPQRERAKDEAVVAAPNPAEAHCAHGGVHPLVHIEVQEERAHGLSLARMRSDGKGRGERNLFPLDFQHWIAPLAVQVPVLLSRADRIDARLINAI